MSRLRASASLLSHVARATAHVVTYIRARIFEMRSRSSSSSSDVRGLGSIRTLVGARQAHGLAACTGVPVCLPSTATERRAHLQATSTIN